jgi:hypothetical protein
MLAEIESGMAKGQRFRPQISPIEQSRENGPDIDRNNSFSNNKY